MTKKKLGFKEIKIPMGMFDYNIFCIIGDYKYVPKYLSKKHDDSLEHIQNILDKSFRGCKPRGQMHHKDGYCPVIWLPKFPSTPRQLSTLAHEAIHAMMEVLYWAQIKVVPGDDEILCHGVGHIINSILVSRKKKGE